MFEFGGGFGGDVPGADDLQARCPEDGYHVGPDGGVLVGEHDALEAVVGHVVGHGAVGFDHAASEVFTVAFDG